MIHRENTFQNVIASVGLTGGVEGDGRFLRLTDEDSGEVWVLPMNEEGANWIGEDLTCSRQELQNKIDAQQKEGT